MSDQLKSDLITEKRAYEDAIQLLEAANKERDQLAAKCAAMVDAIRFVLECSNDSPSRLGDAIDRLENSQWNDLGKGWLSPEKAERLREALTNLIARVEYVRQHRYGGSDPVGTRLVAISDLVDEAYRAKQALEDYK